MKIVVIGGTGLIGSKLVPKLRAAGHEVLAASPSSGVNTLTGEGLAEALAGAQVVVDVANSPSFEDKAVMEFFQTAGTNLLAAETAAGVGHHIALSVVGTERLLDSGYFRAKLAQEKLIETSGIPYTILRATQFMEFLASIAHGSKVGAEVPLPPALIQPIAAEDVASALAEIAVRAPSNSMLEVAGPVAYPMDVLVRTYLAAKADPLQVKTDPSAPYFGVTLNDQSLTPGENPILGTTRYEDWVTQPAPQK